MSADLHESIQRHMAGLTSDNETAALEEMLRRSDDAVRLYLHYVNLDLALEALATTADATKHLATEAEIPVGKRRFTRSLLAIAASLLVMVGGLAWRMRDQSEGRLLNIQGEVEVYRRGAWLAAREGMKIESGDEVRTTTGSAAFQLGGESTMLKLGPATELWLAAFKPAKDFYLRSGTLTASVAPQAADFPMQIQTPMATATVLGTTFEIGVRDVQTGLHVIEGKVNLSAADESSLEVKADENAFTEPGQPVRSVDFDAIRTRPSTLRAKRKHIILASGESRKFTFDQSTERWYLTKGSRQSVESGALELSGPAHYQVLGPTFVVVAGDAFNGKLRARVASQTRLTVRYYIFHDEVVDGVAQRTQLAVPLVEIPASKSSSDYQDFPFRFDVPHKFTNATSIAMVLYKLHADGTKPQPSDNIVIDEITLTRD
jgi:ferric-dicitrate binding protein FerR (iron transport regulator)